MNQLAFWVNVAAAISNFLLYMFAGHRSQNALLCVFSWFVAWTCSSRHLNSWDRLCCLGYSIQGHWDALWNHYLAGHDLQWFGNCFSLWQGHLGCITCRECPDTAIEDGKHVGLAIWGRHWPLLGWIGQRACGLVGHPVFQHPKRYDQYLTDKLYCYRCGAGSTLRKEWIDADPSEG